VIELDRIHYKYDDIHLFLAAPAGECIEVGRIVHEHIYTSTYAYNNQKVSEGNQYIRIYDLKAIRNGY
jgi:hypothetical protein